MGHGFAKKPIDVTVNGTVDVNLGAGGYLDNVAPTASYFARIPITSSTLTAGNYFWSMRNPIGSARTVYIRAIDLNMTILPSSGSGNAQVAFMKFSAATPTGGTAITAAKKRSSYANTVVTDIRFILTTTGLTVTGVTFDQIIGYLATRGNTATIGNAQKCWQFARDNEAHSPIELAAGEGLIFQMASVSLTGAQDILGYVEWDER